MSLTVKPEWWWAVGPSPLALWIIGTAGFVALASAVVWLSRAEPDAEADATPADAAVGRHLV